MASRQYRINKLSPARRPAKSRYQKRVKAKITRLEDGRELEVTMSIRGVEGDVVSLEDDHVYLGLWQPPES
jgi:hypothetical protein